MTENKTTSTSNLDPYKVNSLTGLDTANPVAGKVVWDPFRSIWNGSMLAGALILAPIYFTWGAFAIFLALSAITLCAGHSVGFHRRFIHRSFECPRWLERVLVWCGVAVGMGGPLWTMFLHDHRDWAQRQPDCHALLRHKYPVLLDGLLYLHCRLVLDNPPGFDPGLHGEDERFYRFLDRTWMLHQIPIAIVLYAAGGMPWLAWGIFVRVSICTTMHWAISNRAHSAGPQDWRIDGAIVQGYNVPLMAIVTMGESWHNNHHAFPSSARHGLYPGQIDPGWWFVRMLAAIGLAWNVKLPSELPPRPGISPVTARALSVAAPDQAAFAKDASRWTSA